MRFLLDANLSPALVEQLGQAGYTAVHVGDLELLAAADDVILDRASADGYVLITADSDFPMMLALRRAATPSVILLRHVNELARRVRGRPVHGRLPRCSTPRR